tara:strand:- start:7145 stop:7978 length:834 start_codon:yes stop_codon:yes gene_type:complete
MATIVPTLSTIDTTIPGSTYKPGNGLCVFFWDARYEFYPAGIGSSLGYTNYEGELAFRSTTVADNSASINGIKGGYVGVGFDITGDFSTTDHGKVGLNPIHKKTESTSAGYDIFNSARKSTRSPNTICVRNSMLSGYSINSVSPNLSTFPLTSKPNHERYLSSPSVTLHQQVSSRDDITFHSMRVTLQNDGRRVTTEIKDSDGIWRVYHVANMDTGLGEGALANIGSLRTGIGFTTSHNFMNCDIKNFSVHGNFQDYEKRSTLLGPGSALALSGRII